jgi:hypothetical protein
MIIKPYPKSLKKLLQGSINLEGADIKALLLTDSYTFVSTHEFISDLTGEVTGGSYARQAVTLTAAADPTNQYAYVTPAAGVAFTAITGSVQYVIIAKDTGTGSTSPLILCIDLGSPVILTGQTFNVTFTGNLLELG